MRRFAFILALAAFQAHAAHPLITGDTGTLGAGRWQLEGFSEQSKERATGRRVQLDQVVLSRGLTERMDLQLDVPWYRDGADDLGDVALDLKWRFLERGPLSLGLKPGFTLPSGDERDGRGTGKITWGGLFIASWQPGPLAAHAHVGYRRNENKLNERRSLSQLAAAVTYAYGAVRFVGELARETNPVPGGRTVRYSTLGAIWSVTRGIDFDLGWRDGHGGAPIDDVILLGATLRW